MSDAITPKNWWASKSVWLGVVLTVIGIATYFGDPLHTPQMTLASISEAVGGVALTILRVWFTSTAVAGTPVAQKVEVAKQTIALDAAVQATANLPPTLEAEQTMQNLTPFLSGADLLAIERLPRCRNCGYLRAAHSTCDICPMAYTQDDLDKGIDPSGAVTTWWHD